MGPNQFTVQKGFWKKISNPGKSGVAWMAQRDPDGTSIIIISHTDEDQPIEDDIPVGNAVDLDVSVGFVLDQTGETSPVLGAGNLDDIYYATKIDDGGVAKINADFEGIGSKNFQDVFIQDQTTSFNDFYFTQEIGQTTLTAPTVIDNRIINVTSIANISIGDFLLIVSGVSGEDRFYEGVVLDIDTLEVEMDNPLDFAFDSGDTVVSRTKEMNVDGSVTPQVFEIRAGSGPGSDLQIDITRIMMTAITDDAVDLSKFADIADGLTRGLLLREGGNIKKNKWNIKTNRDLTAFAYDWNPFAATNPAQGVDGFGWRYSLGGQDKHGVTKRIIGNTQTLEVIVQDNLVSVAQFDMLGANHEVSQ